MSDHLVYALDVSSHQGTDLGPLVERHKPGHVIIKAPCSFELGHLPQIFRQQVASMQRFPDVTLGMYGWAFQADEPEKMVRSSVELWAETVGHKPPVVWIDCETYGPDINGFSDDGPSVMWMRIAGEVLDRMGVRKGIYSAPLWINQRWGSNSYLLADWLLWLAHWDGNPQLSSSFMPLYDWHELAAKQWAVLLPGQEEIDRDVIRYEYTVAPKATDETSELTTLRSQVEGLRIALDDVVEWRMRPALTEMQAALDEARRIRDQFLA